MADLFSLNKRRTELGQGLNARLSANTYANFLAQQRGNRNIADITKQFKAQTPRVMSSFLKRGLAGPGMQSGVYERGLQDFATQRFEGINTAQQDLNAELDRLKSERADINANYKQDLADLEAEAAAKQAEAAALLTAFKPYIGG